MQGNTRLLTATGLAALLGACATAQEQYPSLTIREIERVDGQFDSGEPERIDIPVVEVDYEGDLQSHLDGLVATAEQAHGVFQQAVLKARAKVAAANGSQVGSDRWASAQVAVAELDSARSRAATPLGDLDMLYTAARVAAEDIDAIEAARERVIALIAKEDAVLAELRDRIQ